MTVRLDLKTPDGVSQNIERIAALFPHCVTETMDGKQIDFDLLRQELSADIVEGPKERYRLEWPGKREAIVTANMPTTNTLRPVREDSVNFETTENLYIEGDNLEVLKLLQESYLGKIKMIDIDPPYNTGNDFVYRDNFAVNSEQWLVDSGQKDEYGTRMVANPETAGRYHSDWLTMMYPRLKLARNLLTDDGVIFIHIDDNEVHNLRKMCDEIFGEDNFVEEIVWKNKYGAGAKTVGFISIHEYILCYSKKPLIDMTCEFDEEGQARFNKKDDKFQIRGGYMTQPLMTNSLGDRPNLMYDIDYNGVKITPNKQWVWSKERMMQAIKDNEVEFNLQKDGTYSVRSKSYLKDEEGHIRRGKPVTIYNGPFTQDGTKELKDLFDDKILFDFSKPSSLIKKLISLEINNQDGKNDIILDFFSGSATTAHAVMQLNAEDASTGSAPGRRKFIMVQLPEKTDEKSEAYKAGYKNICEIGKERIRRAGAKLAPQPPKGGAESGSLSLFGTDEANSELKTQNSKLDIGFRVYRLDTSNMQDVYYRPQDYKQDMMTELFANHIKPDRTPDDLVAQVMLDWGLPLSLPIEQTTIAGKTVYKVAGNALYCCFDEGIDEEFVRALVSPTTDGVTPSHPVSKALPLRIVFHDYAFANDTAKENVRQLLKQLSGETEMRVV